MGGLSFFFRDCERTFKTSHMCFGLHFSPRGRNSIFTGQTPGHRLGLTVKGWIAGHKESAHSSGFLFLPLSLLGLTCGVYLDSNLDLVPRLSTLL